MVTAGIILTAAAPVVLVAGVMLSTSALDTCQTEARLGSGGASSLEDCDSASASRIVGVVVVSAIMAGTGIPLIIIGAKKVPNTPASNALLVPYAAPGRAGLALRLKF
jgi:hypothetical protein